MFFRVLLVSFSLFRPGVARAPLRKSCYYFNKIIVRFTRRSIAIIKLFIKLVLKGFKILGLY